MEFYDTVGTPDIIYMQKVQSIIKDLTDELEHYKIMGEESRKEDEEEGRIAWEIEEQIDSIEIALAPLLELAEVVDAYAQGATAGVLLIKGAYFGVYAKKYAEELGYYDPNNVTWPYNCINWTQATKKLQSEYTEVEFNGLSYWFVG